jgi:hypothetical protein
MSATETDELTAAEATVPFPSVEWFVRLAQLMADNHDHHAKIGEVDCVAQFTVLDPDGEGPDRRYQVTFEEYEVTDVREVGPADLERADFVIETDALVWQEMIEAIVDGNGDAGLEHSLNRLSLPGVPMRVWSVDPLRRDMFFRFNGSLQEYVNACSKFQTTFVLGEG